MDDDDFDVDFSQFELRPNPNQSAVPSYYDRRSPPQSDEDNLLPQSSYGKRNPLPTRWSPPPQRSPLSSKSPATSGRPPSPTYSISDRMTQMMLAPKSPPMPRRPPPSEAYRNEPPSRRRSPSPVSNQRLPSSGPYRAESEWNSAPPRYPVEPSQRSPPPKQPEIDSRGRSYPPGHYPPPGQHPPEPRRHPPAPGYHLGEPRRHSPPPGQGPGEPRRQPQSPGYHTGEPRRHSPPPGLVPGDSRRQPPPPGYHPGEPRRHSPPPRQRQEEPRRQPPPPGYHPGESRRHSPPPGQGPGEPRRQPPPPAYYPGEPRRYSPPPEHRPPPRYSSGEPIRRSPPPGHHPWEQRRHSPPPGHPSMDSRRLSPPPKQHPLDPRNQTSSRYPPEESGQRSPLPLQQRDHFPPPTHSHSRTPPVTDFPNNPGRPLQYSLREVEQRHPYPYSPRQMEHNGNQHKVQKNGVQDTSRSDESKGRHRYAPSSTRYVSESSADDLTLPRRQHRRKLSPNKGRQPPDPYLPPSNSRDPRRSDPNQENFRTLAPRPPPLPPTAPQDSLKHSPNKHDRNLQESRGYASEFSPTKKGKQQPIYSQPVKHKKKSEEIRDFVPPDKTSPTTPMPDYEGDPSLAYVPRPDY